MSDSVDPEDETVRFLHPPTFKGALAQIGRGPFLEGQVWTLRHGVSLADLEAALGDVSWGRHQDCVLTHTVEILKVFDERGNAGERVLVFLHHPTDEFDVHRPVHTGRVATLTRGILDGLFELVVGPRTVDVDRLEVEVATLRRRVALLEPTSGLLSKESDYED